MVAEKDFRAELRKSYETRYGAGVIALSWPSMFISADSLDLFLCLSGKFIGIECKLVKELPKNKDKNMLKYPFTALQVKTMQRINQAGGAAYGVICVRPLKLCVKVSAQHMHESYGISENELRLHPQIKWNSALHVWEV